MFINERAYDSDIDTNAARYGVPAWVVRATIGKESSFAPKAYVAEPQIGDASRGLMQILLTTARGLGYKGIAGDDASRTGGLYEPGISIALGTKLLQQLRARFPAAPWDEIYSAYQAGSIKKNPAGVLGNESRVAPWREIADYFQPGWRANPTVPAPPPGSRRST